MFLCVICEEPQADAVKISLPASVAHTDFYPALGTGGGILRTAFTRSGLHPQDRPTRKYGKCMLAAYQKQRNPFYNNRQDFVDRKDKSSPLNHDVGEGVQRPPAAVAVFVPTILTRNTHSTQRAAITPGQNITFERK